MRGTGIFTFQIIYFSFFHLSEAYEKGYLLQIGCESYFDIDERILRNDEIAKKYDYSEKQAIQLLNMLKYIKVNFIEEE